MILEYDYRTFIKKICCFCYISLSYNNTQLYSKKKKGRQYFL